MEDSKEEREIDNMDLSILERGIFITAGSILNAGGAFGFMTGLSALQSSWSGVGVFTDERKVFSTNTHKLQKMGWFSRIGGALVSSFPLLTGVGGMIAGSVLIDMGRSKKMRMVNWYTASDLEGDEPIGSSPDQEDLQDNVPDVKEIMEDEGNTQFHNENELSDIRFTELDLDDRLTARLMRLGYSTVNELPEVNEAGLVDRTKLNPEEAKQVTKAVVDYME